MDTYELKIRRTEHLNKLNSQIMSVREELGFNHELLDIISSTSLSEEEKFEELSLKIFSRMDELQGKCESLERVRKAWE